jgi:hypothetical protein
VSRLTPFLQDLFLFLAFYLAWFGATWCARQGYSWLVFIFPAAYLILVVRMGHYTLSDVKGVPWRLAVGLFLDAAMIRAGILVVNTPSEFIIVPLWLLAVWLLFLFSLPTLERPFADRPFLAAALAVPGALLSYRGGELMHLIHFTTPWWAAIYAVFWTIYFPVAVRRPRRSIPPLLESD